MNVKFSKEAQKEFTQILDRYPKDQQRAAMLPTLYLAEKEFGHISHEVEQYVGELLAVPPVKVHEVMTFYTLIAREPRGKYHFQVCRGLSCDLNACPTITNHLCEKLNIKVGETSVDLKYTLNEVECLGACEVGPMIQLNDDYYGNLTPDRLDEILESTNSKK
ncbi:NAD(P)H-dependent oxidoreductase subunit E [bacterium]|nr:NAD(P)H-dependent oxidoreductase subunit E [bacterium]